MLADAQTRWRNARAGYQDSMHVQAGVVQNLQNTQTQISALISSSQSAMARCQALGMAAENDAACQAAWAENRRRFFNDASPREGQ
jgi:conjugative transfer region protein TrbK